MSSLNALLMAFQRDERAVTEIEYALLGALIAMAIVTAVSTLSIRVEALYEMVVAVMPAMP